MKTNHAQRQAAMWGSASPADSQNPDFKLKPEGRLRAPLTFDATNFGNGTNKEYQVDIPSWYASLNVR